MEQKPGDQDPKTSIALYLWLFPLALGTCMGIAIGAALGRVGAGAGLGMGVGVTLGFYLYLRFKNPKGDD